jgi:hypothetical protein
VKQIPRDAHGLIWILGVVLTTLCAQHATGAAVKPNLIFILVDDQGYYDLRCYGGNEFDTPRID